MDGSIGVPVVRRDAAIKAAGTSRYAADFAHGSVAYAALATSRVARGRITRLDTADAEAVAGVRLVLTHRSFNASLGEETFAMKGGHMQSSFLPLTSDAIHYAGQIVALVVADTQEQAEDAARRIEVDVETAHASASMEDPDRVETPMEASSIDVGDAEAAFASAPVKVDATYLTPAQHHNPIELYATTAAWQDGKLLVHVPSQWVTGTQAGLASIFDLPPEDVHVESPFVGGGFGSKATILPHTVLVATAARRLGRPVKLVVPREVMFTVGSFRPATRSRFRLAAERDGRLLAVMHDDAGQTAVIDHAAFPGVDATARMYASPNIRGRASVVETDVNTPGFQRAPAEAPSFFGLESAMDELAVALGMDPVELRLRNEPAHDPVDGLPWSSRSLVACYRRGSALFGWERRNPAVGSMTAPDGTLIGWGCATATYPSAMCPAAARVRLEPDGTCIVSAAAHDLGTGAYTVLGQVAADVLGVPDEDVRVHLGDSTLPPSPFAGGSVTTGSVGSAVHLAATMVRDARDAGAAGAIERTAEWKPGSMSAEQMRRGLDGGIALAGPSTETYASYSFGAQFAEVRVDPLLRTVRVSRMVGVFACGRIINPRTARSNLAGGMVWGASFALLEESHVDRRRARFCNTDLAGYHVATSADIGEVVVETIDEQDREVNAIGAKAVGEIGIVGMPAAIANAIYHATGRRVRKTPILVEDLL